MDTNESELEIVNVVALRGLTLAQIEAVMIKDALKRHGDRRVAVARELGISRSTLLRKMDTYGLREKRVYYSLGSR